jgi:hypothetical protein
MDPPAGNSYVDMPAQQQSQRGASIKQAHENLLAPADFYTIGKEIQNCQGESTGSESSEDCRFRAFFGCSSEVAVRLWTMLVQCLLLPHKGQILHLLWALFFMKCYPTEEPACAAAGGQRGAVDPKTLRKYIWPFIVAIADLESHVVS